MEQSIISDELKQLLGVITTQTRSIRAQQQAVPAITPCISVPVGSSRAQLVEILTAGIEQRFGIVPTAAVEKKLERIFEPLATQALTEWIEQILPLPASHPEWMGIVENVTVHETYFARDPGMLEVIGNVLMPQLIEKAESEGRPPIRIWSAACSTGEEPYNLAFLLLEALLKAGHASENANCEIVPNPGWVIDVCGTDLSSQVISTARHAVYTDFGLGSFRNLPQRMWRMFEKLDTGAGDGDGIPGATYYKVRDFVSRHVRFHQHNLLSGDLPGTERDLVVCRNVMIYFEQDGKITVQKSLAQRLSKDGFLMMGGTDMQLLPELYERCSGGGVAWYKKK